MKDKAIFRSYLKTLHKIMSQGDAREESFYSALEALFNAYANASDKAHIHVTTLPKKTEAGYPDFRIWDGKQHSVGYIEAKHPNERNLQLVSETEQLKRYRHTFPNLILTNFFEFRLYRDGNLVDTVQIARPLISTRLEKVPPLEKADEFTEVLEKFFAFSLPKSYSAESLATELAKRTRFLRDEVISQELVQEKERGTGDLLGFYEAFQTYLIGGLTHEDFADLYAQTITYGLFAARVRVGEGFNRRAAFDAIPHTIGILRDLFRFISLGDLPTALECNVDDIAEVLAIADVQGILHRYFHSGGEVEKLTTPPKGKGADPIVHFYETFLKYYDPKERERRGVYYTPEPVVSYIVRSLHAILKEKFDKPDGLASEGVTLLDPAAGTMTFVAKAAQVAVDEFAGKYGEGSRESFIRDHILRNFYAFELMMAPYAVGHLKMAFFLEELGYRLKPEERVKFYLTNTLETEELAEAKLPGLSSLAEESHKAGKVKKEIPILVVLGNPPYSGISSNTGEWITALIEDYKYVDGKHFGEKKHWLQDDYVKFLRFAEWKIAQSGEGVVGMITNHSYLDNPTFRGMRWHLMQTFNEIYVLNLHGNSLKKERCPDGSKDENVFDIRQGVAVGFGMEV
ncbi:TPA: DNA methyltransferase, partial [Candidatus Acetothermia bacterium]|nr:DNA methyltransferase [Candidatus Acetothermia bacterium]